MNRSTSPFKQSEAISNIFKKCFLVLRSFLSALAVICYILVAVSKGLNIENNSFWAGIRLKPIRKNFDVITEILHLSGFDSHYVVYLLILAAFLWWAHSKRSREKSQHIKFCFGCTLLYNMWALQLNYTKQWKEELRLFGHLLL